MIFSFMFVMSIALLMVTLPYAVAYIWNMFRDDKCDSLVDVLWGLNGVIYTVVFFVFSIGSYMHFVLLFVLLLWGFRLFSMVLDRKLRHSFKEDRRYHDLKNSWKNDWFGLRRFFQLYFLQMVLGFLMLLPVIYFLYTVGNVFTSIDETIFRIGLFLAGAGLFIENLADLQLDEYIKKRKKLKSDFCKEGLWRYSRHPNYFGESMYWLGVSMITSIATPYSFFSWFLITFLLVKVSGIPTAEKGFEGNPRYMVYKEETSAFIPWFVKKSE